MDSISISQIYLLSTLATCSCVFRRYIIQYISMKFPRGTAIPIKRRWISFIIEKTPKWDLTFETSKKKIFHFKNF